MQTGFLIIFNVSKKVRIEDNTKTLKMHKYAIFLVFMARVRRKSGDGHMTKLC